MKNINDICILIQARLGSQRVPGKMLRSFANTTLVDILFEKLKKSKIIPSRNIYFSAYEQELKDVAEKHKINIFHRSFKSAQSEGNPLSEIYEWHDKLPYKYIVLLSACNPLLSIKTIDNFVKSYINSDKGGMFGVIGKKQYFWDEEGKMISPWPSHQKIMNTKTMGITYEAAHCLYASEMSIIKEGYWMDNKLPPEPELFVIDNELEIFDIDYEWQFTTGEKLYKEC